MSRPVIDKISRNTGYAGFAQRHPLPKGEPGRKATIMITVIEPGRYFHVTIENGQQRDADLSIAVDMAHIGSHHHGWMGVLITRHSPTLFTVALSGQVPYGTTAERDES